MEGDVGRGAGRARWFWFALAAIALAGFGLRIAHIAVDRWDLQVHGDALFYHETANHVAEGRGIINPFLYEDAGIELPAADHPPLYVAYLSVFSFLGFDTPNAHLVASALLGTGTIVLAGMAGRFVGGERLALLAAALVAIHPNVFRHDAMLMSETIALFTTALVIWLAYRYLDQPSLARLAAVGVAIGFATLARSELVLLGPFLVIPLLLRTRDRPWADRLRWLGVAAASCVVVIAPWIIRNWIQLDRPMLSSQLEITLATANCDSTYYTDMVGYWDLKCAIPIHEAAGITDPTHPEYDHVLGVAAREYIRDNIDRTPEVMVIRLLRNTTLYSADQTVGFDRVLENNTRWVAESMVWSFRVVALLGIAGAAVLWRRRVALSPLVAPIAVVAVTVVLLYATNRFRAPADLALCILAAAAVDGFVNVVRGRLAGESTQRSSGNGDAGTAPAGVGTADPSPAEAQPTTPAGSS